MFKRSQSKIQGILAGNLLAAMLFGCAVVESKLHSDEPGLVYYLPKTMMRVEITVPADPKADPTIAVRTFNAPDPRHRYTLHYRRNPFFHDRLCYTLDGDNPSLLGSVEVSTEDATPEIAISLAQLIAKTGSGPLARIRDQSVLAAKVAGRAEEKILLMIDLSEPGALHAANHKLAKRKSGLKIVIPGIEHLEGGDASCHEKALCFRTSVKVPIFLQRDGAHVDTAVRKVPIYKVDDGTKLRDDEVYDFNVINHRHIGSMEVDRAFMVEKVTRLGFSEGVLTHVVVRKPSEMLGVVKLPLAIIDTLLSVPANFASKLAAPNAVITNQAAQIAALNVELAKIVATQRDTGTRALGDAAFNGVFKLQCTRPTKGILSIAETK